MEFIIISAATFRRRSSSRDHYQSERAREHWAPKNTEQHKHWHRFGFASHCLLLQPLKWAGLLSLEETADQTQVIPLRWAHFLSLPSFVTHSIEAVAGNWRNTRHCSSVCSPVESMNPRALPLLSVSLPFLFSYSFIFTNVRQHCFSFHCISFHCTPSISLFLSLKKYVIFS